MVSCFFLRQFGNTETVDEVARNLVWGQNVPNKELGLLAFLGGNGVLFVILRKKQVGRGRVEFSLGAKRAQ